MLQQINEDEVREGSEIKAFQTLVAEVESGHVPATAKCPTFYMIAYNVDGCVIIEKHCSRGSCNNVLLWQYGGTDHGVGFCPHNPKRKFS